MPAAPCDPEKSFLAELSWVQTHMPLTARMVGALPDLRGVRLACSMHLEIKMAPLVEGLLARGAALLLTTCNPATVDDDFIAWSRSGGAIAPATRGMSEAALEESIASLSAFRPTHLCEMGAALSTYLATRGGADARATVIAGLEATGSGTLALEAIRPGYPIFNWDDLPIKEGLHNRRMVGLVACHAFFERTRLTFHNRRVLVVGYGLVGRSVVDAARAYGGRVSVVERDPARALEARFAGEEVVELAATLPHADVVITATGAEGVIGGPQLSLLKHESFLINVGHRDREIDVAALRAHPHQAVRRDVERFAIGDRAVNLFAGGSMANLSAGQGDSLNAFDVTAATLAAAIAFIVSEGSNHPPGVHLLPERAWREVARLAVADATASAAR